MSAAQWLKRANWMKVQGRGEKKKKKKRSAKMVLPHFFCFCHQTLLIAPNIWAAIEHQKESRRAHSKAALSLSWSSLIWSRINCINLNSSIHWLSYSLYQLFLFSSVLLFLSSWTTHSLHSLSSIETFHYRSVFSRGEERGGGGNRLKTISLMQTGAHFLLFLSLRSS